MIELTGIVQAVASTTKTKQKQEIITQISDDTKKLLRLTYDPFTTFGVKKIPSFSSSNTSTSTPEDLTPFYDLCERLRTRRLSGHAALNAITSVLSAYSKETADTLCLVLKKDLKANLADSLINKVHKGLIPVFDCMLADKMDERFDWNAGPWLVEYKYDGMRIIAQVTEDSVVYFSRAGIKQEKFQGLFDAFLLEMRLLVGINLYIDGEVLASTFQETMQSRKAGADRSNLVYRAFDMLEESEWLEQHTERDQILRHIHLSDVIEGVENANRIVSKNIEEDDNDFVFDTTPTNTIQNNVIMTHSKICHTKEELNDFYHKLISEGAEGVIIKNPKATYQWKRNRAWIKYKPFYDADLKIVGRYAGDKGTKMEHMLGGFELEGYLEDGTFVKTGCGTGFSEEQRIEYWNMDIDELLGKTVEIQYQEISEGKDSECKSLRFTSFKRFRDDK